ncbi:MAG: stage II sporulation protein M [Theionarchaea archaeon]|nr:MAG: hypothetical protein AYK18_09385 [Theionarchaea archaeon DG-70]MBU7012407.1 stage II sporulation protein M [Theionarchaea archaeon]
MPEHKINWMRVILILGLSFVLVGLHFAFTFYMVFSGDFIDFWDLLVKKGFAESLFGVLLFVVIAKNTKMADIKNVLQSIRVHIVLSTASLVIGVVLGILLQGVLQDVLKGTFEDLLWEAEMIQSIPSHEQVLFIFGNNSRVAALSGVVNAFIPLFGPLVPIFSMLLNGTVIGLAPAIFGVGWSRFLLGILPHGVLELPALILASAVGLKFSISLLKAVIGYFSPPAGVPGREQFLRQVRPGWYSLKLFAVIIPMLVVAAFIEIYITVRILELYGV